ncbi:MAG: PstS family phosphate ABC transporter substrate-binding protein, partial [Deltaproteobacteria bacterium]|nr:PstS family phosphate ABC transporter substrate-binding protein [Deltaproteobacteria bacterium]
QIKGSDTEVNAVQRMAEVYMQRYKGAAIAVTGGGSGVGIAAIINRTTDLANSSRAMKSQELQQAKTNGVDPIAVVFAMDGLSVIVNPANTVKGLTLDQIGQIYRGEIKNWSQVGGPNLPVTLYGRQPNSGTFIFFRDTVVRGDYADTMNQMNGNAQIVEAVKRDKGGIGYVGVGYVVDDKGRVTPGIKVLNVAKDKNSKALSPTDAKNIESGAYPIVRPLYQYFDKANKGKIDGFVRFELSPEGQNIISKQGFFPVAAEYKRYNARYGF